MSPVLVHGLPFPAPLFITCCVRANVNGHYSLTKVNLTEACYEIRLRKCIRTSISERYSHAARAHKYSLGARRCPYVLQSSSSGRGWRRPGVASGALGGEEKSPPTSNTHENERPPAAAPGEAMTRPHHEDDAAIEVRTQKRPGSVPASLPPKLPLAVGAPARITAPRIVVSLPGRRPLSFQNRKMP